MILEKETKEKFGYDVYALKQQSEKLCLLTCDYCGILFERRYSKFNIGRINVQKDACNSIPCQSKKREEVFLTKYGVHAPLQKKEFMEKAVQTFLKSGTTNPFSRPEVKEKTKQTMLYKYGVENPQQDKEIREKTRNTMSEKYGAEYPYQNKETLKKAEDSIEQHFGVRHYGELQKIPFENIITLANEKQYKILFEEKDYKNNKQKLLFKCLKHIDDDFETSIVALRNNERQCPRCQDVYSSKQEQEIYEYILSLGVDEREIVRRDRKEVGIELDLYLPKFQVAIEHHGLFYHSDRFKERELHYDKFYLSKQKGIHLFQIYGDEWENKQEICKSMISTQLHLIKNKINARDCYVLMIGKDTNKHLKKTVLNFIENNHLQGNSSGTLNYFVLLTKKENEIVACLSFRKTMNTRSRKDIQDPNIEIARFCCKKFCSIRGGFSKLLNQAKQWAKHQGYSEIFTYSDCRYSWGQIYEKNSFDYKGHTGIGFYYLIHGERYARFPLSLLDKNQSLEESAKKNGIYKIYNAGNYRWELNI